MDLISVIIPVYNVEPYLADCLDSVLGQTYSNLEIILIEDGSTDQSGQICDAYAGKHSNIRVIHQKNKGLSASRNTGFDQSHGSWIVFVDSDDYLFPDMIQALHYAAVIRKVSFVRCNFKRSAMSGLKGKGFSLNRNWKPIKPMIREVRPVDELRDILDGKYMPTVWAGIYHRSLLQGVRFCEGYVYEDVPFMPQILGKIRSLCRIDEELCVYRKNPYGISQSRPSEQSLDYCSMMLERNQVMALLFPELLYLSQERFWGQTMNLYNKFREEGLDELADLLLERVNKEYLPKYLPRYLFFDRRIPLYRRMLLFGCKISFPCTSTMKYFLYKSWDGLRNNLPCLREASF